MLYSKVLPRMVGEFVRWVNDEEFIVLVNWYGNFEWQPMDDFVPL